MTKERRRKNKLTQQIPHLSLHILHQLPDVRNMSRVPVNRQVILHLPRQVAAEVESSEGFGRGGAELQDYGGCELVVC